MEVVNTLDIDGTQWDIQDSGARSEIAALKTEIVKLKTVEKWEYTVPTYGGRITARRQGNVVNVTGTDIGASKVITKDIGDINFAVLPERFRPLERCFYMLRTSYSYVTKYGGIIFPNGKINAWTYEDIGNGYFSISYIID